MNHNFDDVVKGDVSVDVSKERHLRTEVRPEGLKKRECLLKLATP